MKSLDLSVRRSGRRAAAQCLILLTATLLSCAALAAGVIEARYDDTTHGAFVITSNESSTFPQAKRVTDIHSKAIVEFDSSVEIPFQILDHDSVMHINSTRGHVELRREDGTAGQPYSVNYWLNAVGGSYAGLGTNIKENNFTNPQSCPVIVSQSETTVLGKVLVGRANDYSVHCKLEDSGFTKFMMTHMVGVFELEFPQPLKMPSGVYVGTIHVPPSAAGTVALSDVPIRLVVRHNIKVDFPKKSLALTQYGNTNSRSGPGPFGGLIDFSVTSVDPFKIYLACLNAVGNQCGLNHTAINAKSYPLTIHAEIPDSGQPRAALSTKKHDAPVFALSREGGPSNGKLIFSLHQEMTREMPAGTYSGQVTIIFDAVLD